MSLQLCGRVLDVSVDGTGIVVWAEGSLRTLRLGAAGRLRPGELARFTFDAGGTVVQVTSLGGPRGPWNPAGDGARWSRATSVGSRLDLLWRRQRVVRALRDHLFEHGFLEIESPLLVPGACPDAQLDSVEALDGSYLATSTEYQLKRLLVGGVDRIFSLTKNFRAGDQGSLHSAEFTMLEWARAWRTLDDIEEDAEQMVRRALHALADEGGEAAVGARGVSIDGPRWERLDLRDALALHLDVRVNTEFSLASMCAGADRAGVGLPPSFRDDQHMVVSFLLDELQPHLGHPVPTFLRAWPAFMTSSAELDPDNPHIAQRSELYIAGVEVADGFPFLRDAGAQASAFERENARRRAMGKPEVRTDARYIAALEQGIPPGAGMALGVDRLVMALTGATQIGDTQPFAQGEL